MVESAFEPIDSGELHARIGRRNFSRALVAGGAGFIGSHLCERLLKSGVSTVCLDNLSTGRISNLMHSEYHPKFSLIIQDATEPIDIEGDFDVVFHLASPASPKDYCEMPIQTLKAGSHATLNLLQFCRAKNARFVLASTSQVYGDPLEHPQRESYWGHVNPIGPRSAYDESKRFAEALTSASRAEYGVDSAIVRIFNTYGPRMRATDGRAVPSFIYQALVDSPLTVAGTGEQTRSLCYIDDTVAGIVAIAHSGQTGPMNIGNPEETTILELAERIKALCGSVSPLEFVGRPQDDPSRRRPDISLARSTIGWAPVVSSDDGLTATIAWFREQIAEVRAKTP